MSTSNNDLFSSMTEEEQLEAALMLSLQEDHQLQHHQQIQEDDTMLLQQISQNSNNKNNNSNNININNNNKSEVHNLSIPFSFILHDLSSPSQHSSPSQQQQERINIIRREKYFLSQFRSLMWNSNDTTLNDVERWLNEGISSNALQFEQGQKQNQNQNQNQNQTKLEDSTISLKHSTTLIEEDGKDELVSKENVKLSSDKKESSSSSEWESLFKNEDMKNHQNNIEKMNNRNDASSKEDDNDKIDNLVIESPFSSSSKPSNLLLQRVASSYSNWGLIQKHGKKYIRNKLCYYIRLYYFRLRRWL